jgi:hypothetical protein
MVEGDPTQTEHDKSAEEPKGEMGRDPRSSADKRFQTLEIPSIAFSQRGGGGRILLNHMRHISQWPHLSSGLRTLRVLGSLTTD